MLKLLKSITGEFSSTKSLYDPLFSPKTTINNSKIISMISIQLFKKSKAIKPDNPKEWTISNGQHGSRLKKA